MVRCSSSVPRHTARHLLRLRPALSSCVSLSLLSFTFPSSPPSLSCPLPLSALSFIFLLPSPPSSCLPQVASFISLSPVLPPPLPPHADLLYPLFISQLSLRLYPPLSALFSSASLTPPRPLPPPPPPSLVSPLRPSLLGTLYLLSPSLAACVYYLLGTEAGETGRTSPQEDFHSAVHH